MDKKIDIQALEKAVAQKEKYETITIDVPNSEDKFYYEIATEVVKTKQIEFEKKMQKVMIDLISEDKYKEFSDLNPENFQDVCFVIMNSALLNTFSNIKTTDTIDGYLELGYLLIDLEIFGSVVKSLPQCYIELYSQTAKHIAEHITKKALESEDYKELRDLDQFKELKELTKEL